MRVLHGHFIQVVSGEDVENNLYLFSLVIRASCHYEATAAGGNMFRRNFVCTHGHDQGVGCNGGSVIFHDEISPALFSNLAVFRFFDHQITADRDGCTTDSAKIAVRGQACNAIADLNGIKRNS